MNDKLNEIKVSIQPILEAEAVTLYDLEYVKEGKDYFLRLYIDKVGGVDLDTCSRVSEKVGELLDENDPFIEAYYLEVSSPGAEKPLRTLEEVKTAIGENVYVSLYVHIGDEKEYTGILMNVVEDILTIEYKWKHTTKIIDIPYDKVAQARTAVIL